MLSVLLKDALALTDIGTIQGAGARLKVQGASISELMLVAPGVSKLPPN